MRLRLRLPSLAAFLIMAAVIAADQVTKAIVVASADRLPASVSSWLKLEIVHNTGVSFSLLPGRTGLTIILVSLVIVVVAVLLLTMPRPYAIPLSLVLAGSLGNLIDRIRWGYVVDFVGVWWWPRFNVADFAIVLGACLVVLVAIVQTVRPAPGGDAPDLDGRCGGGNGGGGETGVPRVPPESVDERSPDSADDRSSRGV